MSNVPHNQPAAVHADGVPPTIPPTRPAAAVLGPPRPCAKCGYDLAGLGDGAVCPECGTKSTGLLRRECFNCEYDLSGLDPSGVCPECGKPVSFTLQHPLLRDLGRGRARHAAGGLWGMVGAYAGLLAWGLLGWVAAGTGAVAVALIVGLAWMAVYCISAIRLGIGAPGRGGLKWVALSGAVVAIGALVGMVVAGLADVSDESVWGVLTLVASAGVYAHLASMAVLTRRVAYGLGRRRMAAVGTRWVFYTCIWHGLVLLVVQGIGLTMILARISSGGDFLNSAGPLIGAWFLAWFGHLVWTIVGLVMHVRLARAASHVAATAAGPQ